MFTETLSTARAGRVLAETHADALAVARRASATAREAVRLVRGPPLLLHAATRAHNVSVQLKRRTAELTDEIDGQFSEKSGRLLCYISTIVI